MSYTNDIMADVKNYRDHICPVPVAADWLQQQYDAKKMLPLKELVSGRWYFGYCRNARIALWNAIEEGDRRGFENASPISMGTENGGKFWYIRRKFTAIFAESICHPENDDGFDLFWPVKEVEFPFPTTSG